MNPVFLLRMLKRMRERARGNAPLSSSEESSIKKSPFKHEVTKRSEIAIEPATEHHDSADDLNSRMEWSREITRQRKIAANNFQASIDPLIKRARGPHRQFLFMLRKSQHELARQQKFLREAEEFLMKLEDEFDKNK
jgi:hypothetical protein